MNIDTKRIIKICDDFLQIPSVTCYELPFLNYLDNKIKELGYETILKNRYLVVKPKNNINSRYIFSAHIDRHGLIKNDEENIEYLAYYFKKKLNLTFKRDVPEFYLSCAQRHTKENISSYDVLSGNILNKFKTLRYNLNWKEKQVFFDLDKNSKKEDSIFMLNSNITVQENNFFGQIDNVISAAVLYYLLEKNEFNQEIIFTTQEEIGKSFECILEYSKHINNKKLIVLDTSPYENFENQNTGFLVLRKGDENGKFDLNLVQHIEDFLKNEEISFTYKPSSNGMTELGRISTESNGKINGTTLQLPSLNYHTTYETSTIKSLENYTKVIDKLSK